MTTAWRISRDKSLPLDRPRLMAIINATPDSFYEASRSGSVEAAMQAIADGADILDIGGESTRPGAASIPANEQVRRVVPLITAIRSQSLIPITIDTTSSAVAQAALDAGADAINDVSAGLDDPAVFPLAASRGCGIILMHRLAQPQGDVYSDQYPRPPAYTDVVHDVKAFLTLRIHAALATGISPDSIVLDPGLGFGKSIEQNADLIRRTGELTALSLPILSSLSRKSFVGRISLGRDSTPAERLPGSIAMSMAHFASGAIIFRVHDVTAHARAFSQPKRRP